MSVTGERTPLPPSLVRRAVEGVRYIITGVTPATWFGPSQPLAPMAPADVAGRQLDYPVGYNLTVTPRSEERITFAQLRALADGYDLLRTIIETRKDQLERLQWSIRARSGAGGGDPRIAAIEAFFRRPDGVQYWSSWLRQLLEDLFVVDAPALYVRRNRAGGLFALELIDGTTIKRLIDADGRTPDPPDPAYQQVLHGLPAVDYTTDELIYRPRNPRPHKLYGYSPVEQVAMTVNIALRRQLHQLSYYTEGNVPEALIGTPESWTPSQIKEFQQYWDALLEGNLGQRRHAKFVPGGVAKTFIPTKEVELKSAYDEWLARVICFAFSISPQAFSDHMNRATAETAQDTALAEGLAPIQSWVKQLIDGVIADEFAAPDLEFQWRDDGPVDAAKQASIAQIYVTNGIKTINEARADIGLTPVEGGDAPLIFTGSGPVPLSKIGDLGKVFNPGQLRVPKGNPGGGQWSGGTAPVAAIDAAGRSVQLAQARGGRPSRGPGGGRPGIGPEENESVADAFNREVFNSDRRQLEAVDPYNPRVPLLTPPAWVPTNRDVSEMRRTLDDAIMEAAAKVSAHSYEEHVLERGEFPEVGNDKQLEAIAQRVIRNSPPEESKDGNRTFFYEARTNTLVIINHVEPEQSTIFRPTDRRAYVDRNAKMVNDMDNRKLAASESGGGRTFVDRQLNPGTEPLDPKLERMANATSILKLAAGELEVALNVDDLYAMKGCLSLICNGIEIRDFEKHIGADWSVADDLWNKTRVDDPRGKMIKAAEKSYRVALTPDDCRIYINAMKVSLDKSPGLGVGPKSIQTYTGATSDQVEAVIAKLEQAIASR